jgi:hypothetical protein
MIIVYNASNSLDAHIIKSLLEQQEIPVYLQGEYLQGGVGEVPAIGLVKVTVNNDHYDSARKIITEWESL